ncbi:hypothetical protein [Thalassoglobus sp.]|uniref:hypothetical protein n=1 Tax=Thalassoglobus sp. TaxID=2795869 RepID=UPI003AA8A6EC
MNWTEALIWSAGRSLILAIIGTVIANGLQTWLRGLSGAKKKRAWGGLLLPFFVPSLMTGYCYRDTAMSLIHFPWAKEILYGLIVMMQAVPVAVIILEFSSSPATSATALYSGGLMKLASTERWKLFLTSRFQYSLAAFCLLFVLSFQEADLAALMQASGWTEWMFTKHVGGLALQETISLTLWPILIQIPFLVPIVLWLGKAGDRNFNIIERSTLSQPGRDWFCTAWLSLAIAIVVIVPGSQLIRGIFIGFGSLFLQPSTFRELSDALLIAGTTTVGTLGLAVACRFFLIQNGSSAGRWLLFCLLIPGSMGNLALGLMLAGIFQTEPFQIAYDTPVPLVLGEILAILPRTLILLHCLSRMNFPASEYLVEMLKSSPDVRQRDQAIELAWQTQGRIRFITVAIVGFWAYFEVMLPSILAMPGLAPVGLVLYNNLHYGRIAALGAKLALAFMFPFLIALGVLQLRKLWSRLLLN